MKLPRQTVFKGLDDEFSFLHEMNNVIIKDTVSLQLEFKQRPSIADKSDPFANAMHMTRDFDYNMFKSSLLSTDSLPEETISKCYTLEEEFFDSESSGCEIS